MRIKVVAAGTEATPDALYYLHTDQLATVHTITDKDQNIVWRGEHDAFGQTYATIEALDNPLRFPGQYYDDETGLHYNWHRYYNPATGRYISSDPIGLAGGLNTFGYVGQSPLGYIDPEGESGKKLRETLAEAVIIIAEMFSDGDPTNGSPKGRKIYESLKRRTLTEQVIEDQKKKKDSRLKNITCPDVFTLQDAICQTTGQGCLPGQYNIPMVDI